MKKYCITFILLSIIILSGVGFLLNGQAQIPTTEYLRIHVRADSNEPNAQQVKYLVKDGIVEFLTPVLSDIHSKSQAQKVLSSNLKQIERVANVILSKNGFDYCAKAKLRSEEFPLRSYGEFTLEQGIYDALIVELGSGKGDNWWCVVYPPLCFTQGNGNVVYKSKIVEIINQFKEKFLNK